MKNFGKMTFNKARMKERLPHSVYMKWKEVVRNNLELDRDTADAIAHAMKEWAIENNATHYSHWFFPLNGLTAKKMEAFVDRTDNEPLMRFSGKELIKGEPDASSFPSGGIRSTFEARGYTYWDVTANSFIIDNVLYIPTVFVAFTGEKLDTRAPLLTSTNRLSKIGSEIMNMLEEEHTYRMRVKVGLEQEFFLIDRDLYNKRIDLACTGRTLFGARPPKAQEFEDHYFGIIPERVEKFYREVDEKLWSLGIYSKTEHNEVAPGQFEVAILFENVNIAVDDNQLCMDILKSVAKKHNMVCLLHEKPFKGVNGSGKHNNYSIATNYGLNCFDPGDNPEENLPFLVFVSALIEVVYRNQTLLRIASSNVSNDHRLGGHEAPPAIVSMFLGTDLEDVFRKISDENYKPKTKFEPMRIETLGEVPSDKADRNRTASVAFTGNKFEFRMLGSSKSAAELNIVINTAMADALERIYEELKGAEDIKETVYNIVRNTMDKYSGVIYDKDNYSEEWIQEANRRGLKNHKTLFDALKAVKDEDCYEIFYRQDIFSKVEMEAIYQIAYEEIKQVHLLELRTMQEVIQKQIIPVAMKQAMTYADYLANIENQALRAELEMFNDSITELYNLREEMVELHDRLELDEDIFRTTEELQENATMLLEKARVIIDELELKISEKINYIPTYREMFNSLV
ncbi:glutamine synthetase [Peptoniphilus asaccharolyticus DSM 20463]|uniref:Glutamine synthetase n=1 Tax=Peptoniphilus asaccharolyticus DSM 20463 TaxID=573058 RepID=A0A1W1UID4_PEPAS|nr:glutamine synthetase III [Peptoniphilus asaccharolyticus]MBL7574772.1 glutamine synthetase III [Peptoniphilus asaccharolyticus]SMB80868.1 glutamine synthetase [Peptoniphilus asaccharolyticus DSM 20463]